MGKASANGPQGQFIDINGARIFYEEHGAGDPLVLLHGGLMSSASWAGVVPLLSERYRVITPDSRGHGRSSNPAGRLSYEQLADDAAELIAALGVQRPAVGGWSDGGQAVLELAIRHPDVARVLVIGGALFDFGESYRRSMREAFGTDVPEAVEVDRIEATLGEGLPWFRSMYAGDDQGWHAFLRQSVDMWFAYEGVREEEFRGIGAPALVIIGDRDELVPVEVAVAMYRMLPEGELAICPGATHGLPVTHATWFAETLREFLDRHGATGA